ncbi:MAG: hypothetical protein AAF809_03750 [Bacteroidota bacterium]
MTGLLLVLSTLDAMRWAEEEVVIDAPLPEVWAYVGDSARATEWSVYFHHITPLDAFDGARGARRVCYRRADETGPRWDEVITDVEQGQVVWRRRLRMSDLHGFSGLAGRLGPHLVYDVEQRYTQLDDGRVALRFRTRLARHRAAGLLFRPYAAEVRRVFRLNLENIRDAVEARSRGQRYARRHAYEPTHPYD